MESCLQLLREIKRRNGGLSKSNESCQEPEDDPYCLMEEFFCLYGEKLKAIGENPDSLEPKCQALVELVNDLTEQNCILLKTIEELEKEALCRVEAFGNLADAAKDTIQEDSERRGVEENKSYELECKVLELQEALKQNDVNLSSCLVEIDRLTKCLIEKNSECDKLKIAKERMCELEKKISTFETFEKESCDLIKCLREENEKFKAEVCCADIRLQEVKCQLELLKEELKQKKTLLDKIKCETYSPSEIECLESIHLNDMLMMKDALIEQLINESKDTRIQILSDSRTSELSNNVKWLECQLEHYKVLLNESVECRNLLQQENQQAKRCIESQNERIDKLTTEIDYLRCLINEKELEIKNNFIPELCIPDGMSEQKPTAEERDRLAYLNHQIKSLEEEVLRKDCEIMKHKDQEQNLKYEISRMKTCMDDLEAVWKDKALYLGSELETKNNLIRNYEKQLERMNDQKKFYKDCVTAKGPNFSNINSDDNSETNRLKLKLKDVQEALTAEIADKHDEIRKLKDDVKELEEKFLQSDKQTQFKDDIIKELRKEVKIGRAKCSTMENDKTYERPVNISIKICSTKKSKVKNNGLYCPMAAGVKESHRNASNLDFVKMKKDVKDDAKLALPSPENLPIWESLAEMLGLKGTPRAAMKTRIDHLTGQLEEMRVHVLSLEERLAECNIPAVISLRSRLNSAEGSLLAMCNKMDYVRRYLENLKGDEELSLKCGLEALLSELREDVEWNRQTRRNLSLDEGTSVIVISHRSHSLPDNSLHRLVSKTKSDSVVAACKQASLDSQHSMESYQECRNYIQGINQLESVFEETWKAVCFLWDGFHSYAKDNGDGILNELNSILTSFENSKKTFAEVIAQMENADCLGNTTFLCYNLQCLKENLMDISESLSKAQMVSNSSESELFMEAGDPGVKKKLSTAINDSLSIIQILENLKSKTVTQDKDKTGLVERTFTDVISLIKPLLEEKEKFFEKLGSVQNQQLEFSQTLINKIMEFKNGLSTYNGSVECLRKEIRKLFALILTKEKQIQKQFDEIDNLKMALSSNKYVEEAVEEIDSLRKVVSNKDLQLEEKQELIQNLRSINHSLRKRNFSQSSPSTSCTTESCENVIDKSNQLEEGLTNIKEKFSAMSSSLLRSKDKIIKFEIETRCLVNALTSLHQEITCDKESISKNPEQLSLLDTHFTKAESKVEELLNALEVFICDEQPDLEDFIEAINNAIENLLDINEFIKRSCENERMFMTSLRDENEEMKEHLNKLQNRLTVGTSQQTEISLLSNSVECETEEVYTNDEFIQSLKEDLCSSNSYLEKLQEEFTGLKLEKAEMEERNQKVMEELQAKICKLQAALHNQAPEANAVFQFRYIIEQQYKQQCQFEELEEALRFEISSKDQELEMTKSEVKSLKDKLNAVNKMYMDVQRDFEEAKVFIDVLQENKSEKESEMESLKNKLISVESIYSELQVQFEEVKEFLIEYQEKLSEKERELDEMKLKCGFQQKEIEKMSEELRMKSDQLHDMEISREFDNVGLNMQLHELEELKEKLIQLENFTLHLREEISVKTEEVEHWQTVSNKQKENLASLIEETQVLRNKNYERENEKVKLFFELETIKKELGELTGELVKSKQLIHQLDQEKDEGEHEKESLMNELETNKQEITMLTGRLMKSRHLIYQLNQEKIDDENEKEKLSCELETNMKELQELKGKFLNNKDLVYQLNQEKNIIQDQEEFIEICFLKIAQMNNFLADKDETINILVNQLKTSTMLMLDDMHYVEDERQLSPAVIIDDGITNMSRVSQAAAYKLKLWQSLEINRRLLTMVDSLQHMKYTLLEERSNRKYLENKLSLQYAESNAQCCENVSPL